MKNISREPSWAVPVIFHHQRRAIFMGLFIQFVAKKLSPDAASALLERSQMAELASFPEGDSFEFEKQIPSISGKEGRSSHIRLDQLSLDKSSDFHFRSIFNFAVSACSKTNCKREIKTARLQSESLKSWKVLPPEVSILKVYYGDANKDGYNDVLFQMSDGAAWIFNSRIMMPKPAPVSTAAQFTAAPRRQKTNPIEW